MSISSTTRKAGPYFCNGSTVAFPFAFKVFNTADVRVVLTDATGQESNLVLGTNYSVSLNTDQDANPGGTVTTTATYATGYLITLTSRVQNLQPVTLTNQGGFYPKVINDALDRLTVLVQQLAEDVSRSVKQAISAPVGVNPTLPAPSPYQVIGWNADGTGFQNTDPTYSTALATDLAAVSANKGAALVGFRYPGSSSARTVASKLADFFSIKDYGAKCDGTTDDTVAVQAAITAIGSTAATLLIPGPTKISAALTFGWKTELQFSANGSFVGVAGTELLQVQRQIVAGPHTCFSSCVPMATTGMTVLPEWFGALGDGATDDMAAIQKAIDFLKNTGGVVQFDAHTYAMSGNVNIGTGTTGSTGQNTILQGKGQNSTKLMTTGAAATAIQVLGAAGTPLQGVSIRDLTINKSVNGTGGYGIYAQYTAMLKLRDVQVMNYLYGVGLLRATNTLADKVMVSFAGAANNWHGFDLNGGGTGYGGNASSVFRDCYVDGTGASGTGSIGFYAYGAYVSDLLFDACETTTVEVGFHFDCSTSLEAGNEDVQMINCRADMIKYYGLFIDRAGVSGANSSMFHIIGGWFNHRSNLAESDSIYLNQCRGVVIKGVQFVCFANWAYAYHIKMVSCSNVIVSECLFTDMKYGIYAVSPGYCQITANRFYSQSGRSAANFIVMSGAARVMVTDNIFDGYAANAVSIDATSSGCGIVGNCANISNITTRFSNSGSGPVGAADGSTGLNSGV